MIPYRHPPRPRLFVAISLVMLLTFLLAACGGASTSGGSATPAPGKTGTPQVSCPPTGKARAAIMAPLALGKQNTVVYTTSGTLMRYTVSSRMTTSIVSPPGTILDGQISADGQWILLHTGVSGIAEMQLVRMDGQGFQTLYCTDGNGFSWMQLSPDNKYIAFIESSGDQSTWTFKLLNLATGAVQTTGYDSHHLLYLPLEWLDTTHVYTSGFTPGTVPHNVYLLDIRNGKVQLVLNAPPLCFDAASSVDGTQLFSGEASRCDQGDHPVIGGPSRIQVQPATGGPAQTIYSTPADAITALKVGSSTTLLFLINNVNTKSDHNGLWKINTDGTGLTRLLSNTALISGTAREEIGFIRSFTWGMDAPWANASRDGAFYSLTVFNRSGGPNRLLIGSIKGGAPITFASGSLIGWTTM